MATKGPKTGTVTPAVPKPAAQLKPAAVKIPFAAPQAENIVPAVLANPPVATPVAQAEVAALPEPAPAVQAVSQEVTKPIETVEAVTKPVVEAVAAETTHTAEAVQETVVQAQAKEMTMIEANTAQAQAFFSDMNDRTKGAVEKSTKLMEDANVFAKGNVEALVESSKIAASGLQTLGQDAAEYSRKSFETATATMKTLATVKSPTEMFKLQSDFFRTAFDSYVAEATKNTEALFKLAGEAAQPLSSRVALAAEKVKTAA